MSGAAGWACGPAMGPTRIFAGPHTGGRMLGHPGPLSSPSCGDGCGSPLRRSCWRNTKSWMSSSFSCRLWKPSSWHAFSWTFCPSCPCGSSCSFGSAWISASAATAVNRGNEILVLGGIRPPASAETARHVGGAESERRQHCENAGETKVKASGLEPTGVKRIASFVCLHARRTM